MGFSLFPKTKTEHKERAQERVRESVRESASTAHPAKSSVPARAPENLDEIRKRQAEMTAKIDAIESEMTAEFPPLPLHTSQTLKPLSGVVLPASVRREPGTGKNGDAVSVIQTFISTSFTTDFFTIDALQLNAIELSESSQLPPLVEEVAILYANGQWDDCHRALRDELKQQADKPLTWHLLFEVLQQTGQQPEFEALALDYSVQFESSPPAWRELPPAPKSKQAPTTKASMGAAELVLPARLSAEQEREVEAFNNRLQPGASVRLNLDKLNEADAAGAEVLRQLLHLVRTSPAPITLTGASQAAFALRSKLVINLREPAESVWLATLELYQLLGWAQPFEDLAVDYAVTFEVSPPTYQAPPGHVHIAGNLSAEGVSGSASVSATAWVAAPGAQLQGDIVGLASEAIALLEATAALNAQGSVEVDCSQLGRVDFTAAGALLNWLLAAQARRQHFSFTQVHVLAAALFTVVGINSVTNIASRRG